MPYKPIEAPAGKEGIPAPKGGAKYTPIAAPGKKQKKPGGVMGLLGAVGEVLSAPQQTLFHVAEGVGKLGHGDVVGGLSSIGHGAGNVTDVVGLTNDLGGKHLSPTEALKPYGVKKLPKYVDTTVGLVADPLNLATFGTGKLAEQGIKSAAEHLGTEAAERLAKQGFKKGLTTVEKDTLKQGIIDAATEAGAKNAEKTAAKQIKALTVRAKGGLTARIPGTSKGVTLMSGETAGKVGEATGLSALKRGVKNNPVTRGLGKAFIPGRAVEDVAGKDAAKALLEAESQSFSRAGAKVDDLVLRSRSALKDFEETAGRKFEQADDAYVFHALESGKLDEAIAARPDLGRVIRTMDDIRKTSTDEQLFFKLLKEGGIRDVNTYMHRVMTPEALDTLHGIEKEALTSGGSTSRNLNQSAAMRRSIAPDATVADLNKAVEDVQAGRKITATGEWNKARTAELQKSVAARIKGIDEEAAAISARNLEPQAGELTTKQLRRLASDKEVLKRVDREITRQTDEVLRAQQTATRETGRVAEAGNKRVGGIAGSTRQQLEEAGQLARGDAARKKQLELSARRTERIAAEAERAKGAAESAAVNGSKKVTPAGAQRFDAIQANAATTAQKAQEARAASDVVKDVARPRSVREIEKSAARRSGAAEKVTNAEARTTERLTESATRSQESRLARLLQEKHNLTGATADRAARYESEAVRRAFINDTKRLGTLAERRTKAAEGLVKAAQKSQAEAEKVVSDIAQRLPAGSKLYQESAIVSLVDRGVEAAKAVATAGFINDARGITDHLGEKILLSADDLAAAGGKAPKDWVEFTLPKLGTFHAHPATKAEITKFMSVIGQDEAVSKFDDMLRQANRWWKTQATASLPGGLPFAARNARSNMMLMYADGMNVPKYMKRGLEFQRNVRSIEERFAADIADHGVETVMKRELGNDFKVWKAARDKGVIGDGFYRVELGDAPNIHMNPKTQVTGRNALVRGAKKAVREVAGTEGTLATKGRDLNNWVEQHARLSHFLYNVERLGNLEDAALRTKAVLFDYSSLTPFEQRRLKWINPFYTFARKNTPAQFRAFVENPARYLIPEKVSTALTEPLPEGSPEYLRRQGSRVSKVPGLRGMITKPERPFQAALTAVEPFTQLGAALIPGKQKLDAEKGTPGALRSLLSQVGGIPGTLVKWAAEEATGTSSFTGFSLNPEERRQRAIAALFPALGHSTLSGRLPGGVVTGSRKKQVEDSALVAQALKLLGVNVSAQDPAARAKQKRIEDALKAARK